MQPAPSAGHAAIRRENITPGDRSRPRIAVTLGDPRGIGPEVTARALQDEALKRAADFVVVGPTGTLVPPADTVGTWLAAGSAADAGKLAGAAIERAV